ncbi:hypothetical protein [Bacillus pumilus]|uniref:hypothetical protein n=1 Tax=Bacillus pumilus TaxID=1408 RepID=UPI002852641C|nr:hypothetical protein [Bacillus pumilus]MDF9458058.1 hypothetical protein [Bacillus pumilus]MDF9458096.1 hypothetical protein [Bacillus pumilus]
MSHYKIVPSDVRFKLPYRFDFDRLKYTAGYGFHLTASDALFMWDMHLITRRRSLG